MAKIVTDSQHYTDIAAAIREKNGTETTYKPSEMASAIQGIQSGGGGDNIFGYIRYDTNAQNYIVSASAHNLTAVPAYTFYNLKYLTSVDLSASPEITDIAPYAFAGCDKLKMSALPSGVTHIRDHVFYQCKLIDFKELPPGLVEIGQYAFWQCAELAISTLPESVTSIGSTAFTSCVKIKQMTLPPLVTTLLTSTFEGCTALERITFPSGFTSIANKEVFENCSSLTACVFTNTTTVCTLGNINSFNGTPIASGTGYIYVPDDLVESYKAATNWSTYASQIKGLSELPA